MRTDCKGRQELAESMHEICARRSPMQDAKDKGVLIAVRLNANC